MTEKMEVVSGDSCSPDVQEVTEKINNTTVESLVPRVKCPEHIVSMQWLACVHVLSRILKHFKFKVFSICLMLDKSMTSSLHPC